MNTTRRRLRRLPLLITALAISGFALPRAARACGPGYDVWHVLADGESLPANAGIPVGASWADVSLAVTVDGDPASVSKAEELSGDIHDSLTSITIYQIHPQPEPGQVVEATLFCNPDQTSCNRRPTISYVAGAVDDTAPPPVTDLAVDVHRFPFVPGNGELCDSSSDTDTDTAYYLRFSGHATGCSPTYHEVEFIDTNNETWRSITANEALHNLRYLGLANDDFDPTTVCARVTSFDLAGNKSEPVEVCGACRVRDDDATNDIYPPEKPSWTEADLFTEDDMCVPLARESDEAPVCEDDTAAGDGVGGCRVSTDAPSAWALTLLLGLPLLRRRAASRQGS